MLVLDLLFEFLVSSIHLCNCKYIILDFFSLCFVPRSSSPLLSIFSGIYKDCYHWDRESRKETQVSGNFPNPLFLKNVHSEMHKHQHRHPASHYRALWVGLQSKTTTLPKGETKSRDETGIHPVSLFMFCPFSHGKLMGQMCCETVPQMFHLGCHHFCCDVITAAHSYRLSGCNFLLPELGRT